MTATLPANWDGLTGSHCAHEEFNAATNKHALAAWAHQLQSLTDGQFTATARTAINAAALATHNQHDSHFRAYACMAEATRRHTAAGHDRKCSGWNLYDAALADVMARSGHAPFPTETDRPCTCGQG